MAFLDAGSPARVLVDFLILGFGDPRRLHWAWTNEILAARHIRSNSEQAGLVVLAISRSLINQHALYVALLSHSHHNNLDPWTLAHPLVLRHTTYSIRSRCSPATRESTERLVSHRRPALCLANTLVNRTAYSTTRRERSALPGNHSPTKQEAC